MQIMPKAHATWSHGWVDWDCGSKPVLRLKGKAVNCKTLASPWTLLFIYQSYYNWKWGVNLMLQLREKMGLFKAPWLCTVARSEQLWPAFLPFLWCSLFRRWFLMCIIANRPSWLAYYCPPWRDACKRTRSWLMASVLIQLNWNMSRDRLLFHW